MVNVFFTKKQKKAMRDRRKKKRFYERQAQAQSGVENDKDGHAGQTKPAVGARKRPHQEELTQDLPESNLIDDSDAYKVVIPDGLTNKEARKIRKEARRKARAQGKDESQLVFVVAGQEEPSPPNTDSQSTDVTNKRRKTTKPRQFPNLNELFAEQQRQREQQAGDDRRKIAEAALGDDIKARYVGLDCEMVGTGSSGKQSALARASLVDWDGNVLLDSFVQVPTRVTDFRTQYSGVLPKHLQSRHAMPLSECRQKVTDLLRGKILVGHALKNDLQALLLTHPPNDIRDTAKYRPYQRCGGDGKYRPRKLRDLVQEHCGRAIQCDGESHDSVVDATAAMELFRRARVAWEASLARKQKQKAG